MRIGEVAQRAGVATSRIRFYERQGLLPAAERRENGYRHYEQRTVKIIAFIERAQRLGFSLREIGGYLSTLHEAGSPAQAIIPHVEAKLGEVETHLREVSARRDELVATLATLRREVATDVR